MTAPDSTTPALLQNQASGNWAARYRPRDLNEFVGNEALLATIRGFAANPGKSGTFGITGPTGCGKTTLARLLAQALAASAPGQPRGEIIERDLALDGKVDGLREIAEIASHNVLGGGNRVFILDEIHAVQRNTASALLKVMEEPPPGNYFIWATDQDQKVLPQIRNRSKLIRVAPPQASDLTRLLARIATAEGLAPLLNGVSGGANAGEGEGEGNSEEASCYEAVLGRLALASGNVPRQAIQLLESLAAYLRQVRSDNPSKYQELRKDPQAALRQVTAFLTQVENVAPDTLAVKFLLWAYQGRAAEAARLIYGRKRSGTYPDIVAALAVANDALIQVVLDPSVTERVPRAGGILLPRLQSAKSLPSLKTLLKAQLELKTIAQELLSPVVSAEIYVPAALALFAAQLAATKKAAPAPST